uniref:Protein kinase domain-containing protein n=1 Tax=Oryza nivara TaxID=4536 RepID=A0A0E0FFB9_ORYNI
MAIHGVFHCSTTAILRVISVLCLLAVLVPDAGGRHHRHGCPPFTCGNLSSVSSPFRRRGDPSECGVLSYELNCADDKATIQIDNGTYYVTGINYTDSTFLIVDADISDSPSSCPLPRWNPLRKPSFQRKSHRTIELAPAIWTRIASFVNCSQEIKNSSWIMYMPVACLSTSRSFVYVLTGRQSTLIQSLEPSCGYLAMTPLGGRDSVAPVNESLSLSYADVVKSMRKGFRVQFPLRYRTGSFKQCLMDSIPICLADLEDDCRFLLMPLAVLVFLAHKYWKTRVTIDAVEKFLRMQQMLGPTRYAYTDITAITGHFREKLGQGGYGSVYKGVLLPGDLHVAVKMLNGNSNCNGEEFISEVATIGMIHHVNVVRLVGFCSEEMRRALVYEHMPRGSLDKYIFLSERSFSWDKINEIALGIARGINYLHQGCDMQILHFDIKPHNILLDDNFVPKVADFGLAKLYPRDKSFVPDRVLRGTVGYMAPEMVSRSFGVISGKSDVYSFGMLLLEMAGGRRNVDPNADSSKSKAYYPSWVYDQLIADQQFDEISNVANMHELERKLCLVGLWCIQMKSHDRPTMSEAIEMLEGGVDVLQVPPRPFFCDGDGMPPPQVMDSYFHSSELTAISKEDDGIAE